MLIKGGNSREVVERVKDKVKEINKTLPQGVQIKPFYDRSELVSRALSTITSALAEGSFFVILVSFISSW